MSILFGDFHVPVMEDDVFRIVNAALYGEAVATVANLNNRGGFLIGLIEELEHCFVLLVYFCLNYNAKSPVCQDKKINKDYYFF